MLPDKELVDELRELSGWDGEFTLGYILRRLPPNIGEHRLTLVQYFTKKGKTPDGWITYYKTDHDYLGVRYAQDADTPENAAVKMAIELFKQGILKKEVS